MSAEPVRVSSPVCDVAVGDSPLVVEPATPELRLEWTGPDAAVLRVCEEIGAALKDKNGLHVVVIRSTMLPGTIETVVVPTLEKCSEKRVGIDFGVCINPEFLREGSSLKDFYAPPFTLILTLPPSQGPSLDIQWS